MSEFIHPEYEADSFDFIVLSDSKGKEGGINREVLSKLLGRMNKLDCTPSFIAMLGDSVAGSEDHFILREQLSAFKALIHSSFPGIPILPVAGNHEIGEEASALAAEKVLAETYKELVPDHELHGFNKSVYYKDIRSLRIIVLNCFQVHSRNKVDIEQLQWLKQYAADTTKFKILLMHMPAYPTGAHLNTCLDLYPDSRDKLWSVIDECDIDLVLCGHEHNYSRRLIDASFSSKNYTYKKEIFQVVAGGGGEKLKGSYKSKKGIVVKPKAKHHFLWVTVKGKELQVKAIAMDGKLLDSFIVRK